MSQYIVESTHTKETCLEALDEMVEKDSNLLKNTWFGCTAGDHRGWTTIKAMSEKVAKEMLPNSFKNSARIVQVYMFTPAQIESFHK